MFDVLVNVSLAVVASPGGGGPANDGSNRLVKEHRPFSAVTVLRVTPGATFMLQVGNAQPFPVPGPGIFYGFDPKKEGNLGLFIINPTAQAGASCDLLVGYVSDEDAASITGQ